MKYILVLIFLSTLIIKYVQTQDTGLIMCIIRCSNSNQLNCKQLDSSIISSDLDQICQQQYSRGLSNCDNPQFSGYPLESLDACAKLKDQDLPNAIANQQNPQGFKQEQCSCNEFASGITEQAIKFGLSQGQQKVCAKVSGNFPSPNGIIAKFMVQSGTNFINKQCNDILGQFSQQLQNSQILSETKNTINSFMCSPYLCGSSSGSINSQCKNLANQATKVISWANKIFGLDIDTPQTCSASSAIYLNIGTTLLIVTILMII